MLNKIIKVASFQQDMQPILCKRTGSGSSEQSNQWEAQDQTFLLQQIENSQSDINRLGQTLFALKHEGTQLYENGDYKTAQF